MAIIGSMRNLRRGGCGIRPVAIQGTPGCAPVGPGGLSVARHRDFESAIGGELVRNLYSHAPTTGLIFLAIALYPMVFSDFKLST